MTEAATINAVMRALADPTRRTVFERVVRSDEITVAELTRGSGVTQGAISQHLKVLKEARLVRARVEAQRRIYHLDPAGFTELETWLAGIRQFWQARLDRLERALRNKKGSKR